MDEVHPVDDVLESIGSDGILDDCEVVVSDSEENCSGRDDDQQDDGFF